MIKEINDTIDFIMKNDPASKSKLEVLLLYPGLHAVIGHKISNFLYKKDLFFNARLVSQIFRFFTNIEIHPGAQINGTLAHATAIFGFTLAGLVMQNICKEEKVPA